MFNFLKRKRVLRYFKIIKSAIFEREFKDFLQTVKFYKNKISLIFEFPESKTPKEAHHFEKEVKNITKIAGFKEKNVSVLIHSKTQKEAPINEPDEKLVLKGVKGVKNIICVAACKGGVGKSTASINLAHDFKEKGFKVGLLDGDIYGPSIPIMLGIENLKPEIENGMMIPIEKDGIKVISMGFFVKNEDALMWRGPMITKSLRSFFEGVNWGDLDLLVVDLPPGTGDVYISLLSNYKINGVLMVSTPHTVALEELKKTIQLFKKFNIKILGILENMIEKDSGHDFKNGNFKMKKYEFTKDGFIKMNLNFADKIKLDD
jgi:ATP-binding protein involved in chromosome partitioning